jgi:membrane protein
MPPPKSLVRVWNLLRETVAEWSADQASRLAAGLSYYAVFAIAPLLIIAIAIAGAVFGREAAQGEIVEQLDALLGREGAFFVQELIEGASRSSSGVVATLVGLVTLLFAATGVFEQLQFALNAIWDVEPQPRRGLWKVPAAASCRSRWCSASVSCCWSRCC